LELERQRGDDSRVAHTSQDLSGVNRLLDLNEEGTQQAKEALEIYEWTGDIGGQKWCLSKLVWSLFRNNQLDSAKGVAFRAIGLVSGRKGEEFPLCDLHRVLGYIYQFEGEKKDAIRHFETVLRIAPPFDWRSILLFWTHYALAELLRDEDKINEAHA
jgi:tetratricopeptide (TPR) repeat protein